ncbi:four-jointed box protein 1-like [Diadema antillarum]|uniref:four-jointed box protein 1-like n=2 Tax=Diadema antillarum TaxID=105358 RepID=UPI003A83BC76
MPGSDKLLLSEVFSYHLARLLGLRNVPPVVLSRVSFNSSSQWSTVVDEVQEAGWTDDSLASLSLWVDDLGPTKIPKILSENQKSALTPSTPGFSQLNITQLMELAQYSDLFVFDYLTAHIDRLVVHREGVHSSGDESIYGQSPIHNLRRHQKEGGLWVVDNESGLFAGYSFVYSGKHKWQGFVEEILHSVCIFRRSTVAMVNSLAAMEDPGQFLLQTVYDAEPELVEKSEHAAWLNMLSRLKGRIEAVARWIADCQTRL